MLLVQDLLALREAAVPVKEHPPYFLPHRLERVGEPHRAVREDNAAVRLPELRGDLFLRAPWIDHLGVGAARKPEEGERSSRPQLSERTSCQHMGHL